MEDYTSLTSLLVVVVLAFFIPIALHKFKLRFIPVVVAEILVGLIIGKSGFNIITADAWLELLSLFGLIYLMFLSGLEIDFSQFRKKGNKKQRANPFVIAVIVFVGILTVSYGLAYGFMQMGFVSEPYLLTIIIATISLGVVVPVLKEQKLTETPLGQTILLITVISDFVTMILLAVYLSFLSESLGRIVLLISFFLLVVLVFFIIKHFLKGKIFEALQKGSSQIGTRGVFALILVFVVLSENMGVENILGAFLAGVIVALLVKSKSFIHQLESFGYGFLLPIFFVMTGVKLDVWVLFTDWKIVLFIPLLLVAIFLSKLIPSVLMRFWFGWRETWSAGILISSTLSLVIAAATVAHELNIIDASMYGALILVAIISCFVAPIIFARILPKQEAKKIRVSIIGANHITLPVSKDLLDDGYEVRIYSSNSANTESKEEQYSRFPLIEVDMLDVSILELQGAFDADVIVCGSLEEEKNIEIAHFAHEAGIERIIVRLEDPDRIGSMSQESFMVFSTLHASRVLLKGMIDNPSALRLITQQDDSIQEIVIHNPRYEHMLLRNLPYLGQTLVLRIYRGESFIIPHGSTSIQLGDRFLVSGDVDDIVKMRQELE